MKKLVAAVALLALAGCTKTETVYVPTEPAPVSEWITSTTSAYCSFEDKPSFSDTKDDHWEQSSFGRRACLERVKD